MIEGAIALIAILIIIQMWLLTAALEAHLAGHEKPVMAGAVVSAILFALTFAIYRWVIRSERKGAD